MAKQKISMTTEHVIEYVHKLQNLANAIQDVRSDIGQKTTHVIVSWDDDKYEHLATEINNNGIVLDNIANLLSDFCVATKQYADNIDWEGDKFKKNIRK